MKTYLFYGSTNAPYDMKIWKVLHLLNSSEIVMDIAKIILNHLISFKEIFNTIKVGKYFNSEKVEYNAVICATENDICEITPTFQRFNSYLSKETERMMKELFFDLKYFVAHQYDDDGKLVDEEDAEIYEKEIHYGCLITRKIENIDKDDDNIYYYYGLFSDVQMFLSFGHISDDNYEVEFMREYTFADFRNNYKGDIDNGIDDSDFIAALKKRTLELGYEICSDFGFCCVNP